MHFSQWISDTIIGISYLAIPVGLLITGNVHDHKPITKILVLFATFILFCGGGHFIDAWYEWRGMCSVFGKLRGLWNIGTAIASVTTASVVLLNLRSYVSAAKRPFDLLAVEARLAELERQPAQGGTGPSSNI